MCVCSYEEEDLCVLGQLALDSMGSCVCVHMRRRIQVRVCI
jgi:hypothetical protein